VDIGDDKMCAYKEVLVLVTVLHWCIDVLYRWITCCLRRRLSVTCRRRYCVTSHYESGRSHICCSMHDWDSWM